MRRRESPLARFLCRLIFVGFLCVVVAGITLILEARGRVERAEIHLVESGCATHVSELIPAPVPDSENRAILYQEAYALLKAQKDVPSLTMDLPIDELPSPERESIIQYIKSQPRIFEIIREARARPSCRYSINYETIIYPETPDSYGTCLLSGWLRYLAQTKTLAGHDDEARAAVRDILAMADGWRDEPLLLAQMIRCVIIGNALSAIRICSASATSIDELDSWLAVVPEQESLDGSMRLGMRGEVTLMMEIMRDPFRALFGESAWYHELPAALLQVQSAGSLRNTVVMVRCADLPYPESAARVRDLGPPPSLGVAESTFDIIGILMPSMGRGLDLEAVCKAAMAVTRQGLVHEITYLETGRYPEECSAIDPCTGKLLVHDREKGEIRSAGPERFTREELEEDNLVWRLHHR